MKEGGGLSSSQTSEQFSQDTQLDSLSSGTDGDVPNVQQLMLEAHRCIGDPDGVYGYGAGKLANVEARYIKLFVLFWPCSNASTY